MPRGIHRALLIYNTASGRRRGERLAEVEAASIILKQAGINSELAPTTGRGSATELARQAVADGRQMVIVCGGDGTINEVVNGLAGSQVPMALLPAGTANILAKELGIPWDIAAAAGMIAGGELQRIALGLVNSEGDSTTPGWSRYFLSVGGAGPDGAMVHALETMAGSKSGIIDYWLEGVRQLVKYRFPEMRITCAGHDLKATLIVVGRTQNYGGPFCITQEANLLEDCFEIVAVSTRNRLRYLACLPALWLGKLRQMPDIHHWKTTEVLCEPAGSEEVFAQVDGEPIGKLPLRFSIVPDALTLLVPSGVETARVTELQTEVQGV
jgi:YegS/Rv2252/BmrU family lipid kinase